MLPIVLALALSSPFSGIPRLESQLECAECTPALPVAPKEWSAGDRESFRVHGLGNITSFAGFFTTVEETNNNMFWWYFPSQDGNATAPVLIWLQGGPGGSSLFGLFSEMGPFELTADLELVDRPASWNKKYGMLFIDNPVGAGFSYTTQDAGYCKDSKHDVAVNLYSLLVQFYGVFPELLRTDLYITGESYGGHYVPAISHYIHLANAGSPSVRIPLKGLAIGDGWIDPVEMIPAYPELMYSIGAANTQQRAQIQTWCDETVEAIKEERYTDAFKIWDQMLNGDIFPYPNYFHNITGSNNYDNFLMTESPPSFAYYARYVNQPYVREALHVGNATFNSGAECERHLVDDFMRTLKPELADLMDNYKVLVYSGQLDVIIGVALTERFLQTVNWTGQSEFLRSDRMVWRINSSDVEVAGFARVTGKFQQVVIREAGHIVPYDQPWRALDMITRFVEDIPYENLPNPVPRAVRKGVTSALVPDVE